MLDDRRDRDVTSPQLPPKRLPASWSVGEVLDGTFFVLATAVVFWLGWVLLRDHRTLAWGELARLVVFWALVAYVGLPRLQQVLTRIYVPDYFIGRTTTSSGILGDPVNLAVQGRAEQVHAAMSAAGWTRADDLTLRSGWGIVVSAVLRRSYRSAPVSGLFLFGRLQAFAYEMEVGGDAARRHHVRFWPTPADWVLPGGQRVDWLAAGTYDRAVGLSLFTLQVTHKIDADIDVERDHVVATVRAGSPHARTGVLSHFVPAFRSRNGGGDVVRTDGSLVVLDLTDGPADDRAQPAEASGRPALADRRTPPVELGLAAAVCLVKTVAALVGAAVLPVPAVLALLLCALVWARQAWARLLLMALSTVEAVVLVHAASADPGPGSLTRLLHAGAAALVLVTVSSDGARRWVTARRPAARAG
ncbi:LssY C-terminal domain-containing protein [Kineococcus rhizosphaerae]|uniref:LssY-like putative type I secretion system component LssY n=1 Tax=Kineococcus rhizosphaerae TaxID=559628 RepID=A0A2T0QZJ4_9ACTN|nr:LssY C-terminal domain-containing protein [Kineococcus rhizosphaerae]PRY12045.1 LssY-like putative type I secretion system component LssY [Kineococcus rhizosphaerae]